MTLNPQLGLCLAVGLMATVEDLWHRRISNWIPLAGLVSGLVWHGITDGWSGLLNSVVGTVAGFLVFLVFYILGGMGGGDVKLMAGFGAILGWRGVLWASLWTAALGGVLALLAIGGRKLWRWGAGRFFGRPPVAAEDDSIPYAPAIALGALMGWASISLQ